MVDRLSDDERNRALLGLFDSAVDVVVLHSARPQKVPWIIAGHRSRQDSIASLVAAHAAAMIEHLRPCERGLVMCLACGRKQAKIVASCTRAFFDEILPASGMGNEAGAGGPFACGLQLAFGLTSLLLSKAIMALPN